MRWRQSQTSTTLFWRFSASAGGATARSTAVPVARERGMSFVVAVRSNRARQLRQLGGV
jgi:hypothetical protein